jgi:hypothetical protein
MTEAVSVLGTDRSEWVGHKAVPQKGVPQKNTG